jgi:hypothetical protein
METGDGVGSGMGKLCRYWAEKSDSLVVLMKGPNNCRLWVGGGSGGKGWTLENTRPETRSQTQNWNQNEVSPEEGVKRDMINSGLARVREWAKKDKSAKFTARLLFGTVDFVQIETVYFVIKRRKTDPIKPFP